MNPISTGVPLLVVASYEMLMGADSQAGLSVVLPDETISPEYPIFVQNASLYTT